MQFCHSRLSFAIGSPSLYDKSAILILLTGFSLFVEFLQHDSRDKAQASITKKQEQSQQMAKKIQEMQSAMQKAAVEAAKAVAAGQS